MNTIYPPNYCSSFNEWTTHIRKCMNEYKRSNQQQEIQETKNQEVK